MSKNFKFAKKIILFFIGIFIIQLGVAIFIKTSIGSDPFSLFTQGLSKVLNTTQGKANMVILICTTVLILILDRKRIKIGTVICAFGVGPIIDLCIKLTSNLPLDSMNIIVKSLIVVLGCFLIAIGFSIVSATDIGVAPNDIIPFIIQDKLKFEYKWIRIGLDFSFFAVGALLGGIFGIGTIISVIITGPFIQFCLPYGKKIVDEIIGLEELDLQKNNKVLKA